MSSHPEEWEPEADLASYFKGSTTCQKGSCSTQPEPTAKLTKISIARTFDFGIIGSLAEYFSPDRLSRKISRARLTEATRRRKASLKIGLRRLTAQRTISAQICYYLSILVFFFHRLAYTPIFAFPVTTI